MKDKLPHEEIRIPVVEEVLSVGKQAVVSGEVRIEKRVDTTTENVSVDLTGETVEIDRIAYNTYVDVVPQIRHEGDKTIIPVVKEVLVVEKKLMLVEEIHLYKSRQTKTHREDVSLRKESVKVHRNS